jgi:hypothetical protein
MCDPGKNPSPAARTAHRLSRFVLSISTAALISIFALSSTGGAVEPTEKSAPKKPSAGKKVSAKKTAAIVTPESIYELPTAPQPQGKIDELVFARLQKLGVSHAHVCTDAVFVRRVFLDVIGTLPTAAETGEFLKDKSPSKRAALIDRLLARDEYADYWGMKWSDLLRVKAEFPVNLWPNAAQAYHHWIVTSLRAICPTISSPARCSRRTAAISASAPSISTAPCSPKSPPPSRAPSPSRLWASAPKNGQTQRLNAMGAFFTQLTYKATGEWKEEIVFFDPNKPQPAGDAPSPKFPDGTPATLSPDRDGREIFANWLVAPQNPWFTRVMANRVWSWLLGRGIVHEPDDFRTDNPPTNPALLDHLAAEFVAARFDVKQLMRMILNSQTYQLSSLARSTQPEAEANFAFYAPRRLDAEVLIDALNQITGTHEKYSSAIPEPFTFIPEDQRSIALPDGSITSSFLETFGRPFGRDTGLERNATTASPRRNACTLLNSTHVQRKLEQGPKLQALSARATDRARSSIPLLTILSRPPPPTSFDIVQSSTRTRRPRRPHRRHRPRLGADQQRRVPLPPLTAHPHAVGLPLVGTPPPHPLATKGIRP